MAWACTQHAISYPPPIQQKPYFICHPWRTSEQPKSRWPWKQGQPTPGCCWRRSAEACGRRVCSSWGRRPPQAAPSWQAGGRRQRRGAGASPRPASGSRRRPRRLRELGWLPNPHSQLPCSQCRKRAGVSVGTTHWRAQHPANKASGQKHRQAHPPVQGRAAVANSGGPVGLRCSRLRGWAGDIFLPFSVVRSWDVGVAARLLLYSTVACGCSAALPCRGTPPSEERGEVTHLVRRWQPSGSSARAS